MKVMKIIRYFVVLSALVMLSSCNDWLDLQPVDTTTETDLFATGDGYRNALNGVYRQMATSDMYGKALSWGELDAMGQLYSMTIGYSEYDFASYNYKAEDAYSAIQTIWSKAYNSIANCNNIIQRLENESSAKFAKGEVEMKLIKGEALALRALLHFDMLRLFAPAKDDNVKHIPYVTTYPCTFQEYTTNHDILEKVRKDLEEAKQLVGEFDIPRKLWFQASVRFENTDDGLEEERPTDLFFAYRGYRLNYYAICGLLSRVYLYSGMYKEAYDATESILNLYVYDDYPSDYYRIFKFSPSYSVPGDGNTKFYDGILFCLSNQRLSEDYRDYRSTAKLYLKAYDPFKDWYASDKSDVRYKLISSEGYDYYCNKNLDPGTGNKFQFAKDMLPMIRLSELHLIRAEYFYQLGDEESAAAEITKIRDGRGCFVNIDRNSKDWFNTAIIDEARREFMCEGQLFYYYKRLNILPSGMSKEEQFVLPLPNNESL